MGHILLSQAESDHLEEVIRERPGEYCKAAAVPCHRHEHHNVIFPKQWGCDFHRPQRKQLSTAQSRFRFIMGLLTSSLKFRNLKTYFNISIITDDYQLLVKNTTMCLIRSLAEKISNFSVCTFMEFKPISKMILNIIYTYI